VELAASRLTICRRWPVRGRTSRRPRGRDRNGGSAARTQPRIADGGGSRHDGQEPTDGLEQVPTPSRPPAPASTKDPFPIVAPGRLHERGEISLMNALTRAGSRFRDQLFATLDPTLRRLTLPETVSRSFRTRSGSSGRSPTSWSPRSRPPWKRCRRRSSCCTWWMSATRMRSCSRRRWRPCWASSVWRIVHHFGVQQDRSAGAATRFSVETGERSRGHLGQDRRRSG